MDPPEAPQVAFVVGRVIGESLDLAARQLGHAAEELARNAGRALRQAAQHLLELRDRRRRRQQAHHDQRRTQRPGSTFEHGLAGIVGQQQDQRLGRADEDVDDLEQHDIEHERLEEDVAPDNSVHRQHLGEIEGFALWRVSELHDCLRAKNRMTTAPTRNETRNEFSPASRLAARSTSWPATAIGPLSAACASCTKPSWLVMMG